MSSLVDYSKSNDIFVVINFRLNRLILIQVQYELAVKKLADFFLSLEQEGRTISNEDNTEMILGMLEDVLHGLNRKGSCSFTAQEFRTELNVLKFKADPPEVKDYHVPILPQIPASEVASMLEDCDLILRQVLLCFFFYEKYGK